ncbi:hypothetical protein [Deinococcus puniceus]|uniref:Uncharacterized protein n=1 Tax=Deinococcus puniceus TaxID=1182568 RepID=A0A172T6H1_9DEIO|nr:hypothetical protein [Deinococcus puniceus]ANE42580.1 hypothetical protein SU48_01050 [Deinococcus puniceus]
MSLFDPIDSDFQSFLFVESVVFPQVLALPTHEYAPEGELYTFCFANGYGALVVRLSGHTLADAFELCVLDCTQQPPQPTFRTPVAASVLPGLSHEAVTQLLVQAEQLPSHPALLQAQTSLLDEVF